jgi:PAS domain S-box-containing protein
MMKEQEDLFSTSIYRDNPDYPNKDYRSEGFLILDGKGNILQISEELMTLISGPRQDLIGTNLTALEGNEWLQEFIDSSDHKTISNCFGKLHFLQSDQFIEVEVNMAKISAIDNSLATYCLFIQLQLHETIRLKQGFLDQDNLRIIANSISDAISLHDLNGKFLYVSTGVEKLHGYSIEELKKLGELYAVHPDDINIIRNVLERIIEKPSLINAQYRFIHKKGHTVWVESSCNAVRNEAGEPVMISVITRDITIAKFTEDTLKYNEAKYRTLVKNLPTGVLLMNTKGEILEVNQALLDILGSPGEEPTRMINLFEFENLVESGITANLKHCIEEKKVITGQAEYLSKWGKRSFLMYSAVPVFDHDGEICQVICNVRDITQMKRAEEKSQQQIEFLNVVINTMQEPFFVKDENHRWIMLNDAAVEMMGKMREELIGKTDYDLYPKEQANTFWEKDSFVFENGTNVNEEKITWSDGTERSIVTYKRLYTENSTGKKFIVGTIHDISDIKNSEIKLGESEKKYRDLFDNANDHIFTTDLQGTFTNANKAMLDKIGITIEEIGNFNIFSFCKPEMLENAKAVTLDLLETGSTEPFEIETIEKDGKSVILEIQARIMFKDGQPIGIQGIARDISEKKLASQKLEQMNKELQESNASKDKFYSIIAHDLKNPFNSLIGFSELLLEDFDILSKDEMRDYVGIIRNTAKNSLILLENLLAWSRLQTGRMIYNPVNLVLSNEVDSAVTVLFSLSYRKKLEVENTIDRQIIVMADQNMLLSIMHNLLMNAIKFTSANGSITISCKCGKYEDRKGDYAEISVIDTGIGISKDELSKLFSLTKPFTKTGTEKESGTGLGLMLTREMVEKHGSILKIESEPGKGSVFSFRLPLFVP